jgi:CIC family chloride channel protein
LLSVIAGVFMCKLLAVLASSGSGAPGGVFTPTLFVGMATGMLFAQLSALWFPGSEMAILLGLAGNVARRHDTCADYVGADGL